ncbi:MAG: hypothetical protein DRN88_03765 [Candidatus Hydrothermarchaeota archaeon]|nr:MAG: hypothetical protein DRN88_03765 [Candidatus Hydrothermarchaeota archaeon]
MKLSDFERDVLKEICNMGASHAANSLSHMVNKKIMISIPEIMLTEPEKVYLDGIGVYLIAKGELSFALLLTFSRENALNLVDILMGRKLGTTKELDEMDISAIQEVGNILGSHFVNTFSDFLGFKIYVSPPNIIVNSYFNEILKIFESKDIKLLLMNTSFIESNNEVNGNLIVLSNAKTLNQIFDAISEKI